MRSEQKPKLLKKIANPKQAFLSVGIFLHRLYVDIEKIDSFAVSDPQRLNGQTVYIRMGFFVLDFTAPSSNEMNKLINLGTGIRG